MEKTIEAKVVEHHWKPMEEFKINDQDFSEMNDWEEGQAEDKIAIIRKLKPNQYIKVYGRIESEQLNPLLNSLRENGLDIGKGNCEYGYRMPLPQDGKKERELIIFRRY